MNPPKSKGIKCVLQYGFAIVEEGSSTTNCFPIVKFYDEFGEYIVTLQPEKTGELYQVLKSIPRRYDEQDEAPYKIIFNIVDETGEDCRFIDYRNYIMITDMYLSYPDWLLDYYLCLVRPEKNLIEAIDKFA